MRTIPPDRLLMQLMNAAAALLAVWLGSGCGTVDVRSTAEAGADFSRYHTYSFAPSAQPSDSRYFTPTNQARFKAAIQREMDARSFRLADAPDLQISFYLLTDEKLYDRAQPETETGTVAYNLQKHYGFRYDTSLGSAPVVNYTEGTLVVHAVDTRQNRMVWEGITRGVLYRNRTDEQIETRVREAVGTMFKKFPAH